MQEILSLILGQLRSIWRFRWVALAVAWGIAVVGWFYVYSLPNQYESSARVYIDTKSAIDPLLKGLAVTPNAQQRASLLINTVLSRPNLIDIARSTGMNLAATTDKQEQALIDGMQKRIKLFKTVRHADLYKIEYTSSNPKLAQAVVLQIMSIMTTRNLSLENQQGSQKAIDFLTKEVDKYKKKLSDTEHELADFKKHNAELLPGSSDYVSRVQELNATIDALTDQLSVAHNRKSNIKQQLRSGGQGGRTRVAAEQSSQVMEINHQLDGQEQQLAQLLTKYTPKHPDVVSTENRISDLKQRRQETITRLRANPSLIQTYSSSEDNDKARLTDRLNDTEDQISTLELTLKRRRGQLEKLQSNSGQMNQAEATLAKLSRDYEVTRQHYKELQSRLYNAHLSSDVQKTSDALKFNVIDPPEVPAKPTGPKRLLMMAIVLFGALVGGMAFAWLLAQIRPVFNSRRDLTESTGFPVIGSLGLALSPAQIAARRATLFVFFVGCLSILAGFAAAIFFMPMGVHLIPNIIPGPAL